MMEAAYPYRKFVPIHQTTRIYNLKGHNVKLIVDKFNKILLSYKKLILCASCESYVVSRFPCSVSLEKVWVISESGNCRFFFLLITDFDVTSLLRLTEDTNACSL
jgi:hypothetical protein